MSVEMKTLTIDGTTYDIVDETARNAINHTHSLPDNPTGGVANDTVSFWVAQGTGYCWISTLDQIANQPSQYGFLINYAGEADAFQIYRDQNEGATYFRSGDNVNGWFSSWTEVVTADYVGAAIEAAIGDVIGGSY